MSMIERSTQSYSDVVTQFCAASTLTTVLDATVCLTHHLCVINLAVSGSISGGIEALGGLAHKQDTMQAESHDSVVYATCCVVGGWGKSLVLGVQAMVAEEGDAAAADGLARLARESGLARLGSGGDNGECDLAGGDDINGGSGNAD